MSGTTVIELIPPEAAEQAAWMLRGHVLGQGKISIPLENANEHTLNSVISMLDATWQQVEEEHSLPERSDEIERNLNLCLDTLQDRIEALMARQAESSRRQEVSQHLVVERFDEPSAQQRFEALVERNITGLNREDFAEIDASNRTLRNYNFNQSDLRNANFENARLSNCTFEEANLAGANFKNAQMPGTLLSSAVLTEANFEGANLCGAQMDWANLRSAIFCNTNLQNASFESSNLSKADCSEADFTDANLSGAKLKQAICIASRFNRANLTNANLEFANLMSATFSKAQLGFATLEGSKGFNHRDHRDADYQKTKVAFFTTHSSRKPIIKTLTDWTNLVASILAVCIFTGAGVYGVLYMAQITFSTKSENQNNSSTLNTRKSFHTKQKARSYSS